MCFFTHADFESVLQSYHQTHIADKLTYIIAKA